jgi:hypothetical protein
MSGPYNSGCLQTCFHTQFHREHCSRNWKLSPKDVHDNHRRVLSIRIRNIYNRPPPHTPFNKLRAQPHSVRHIRQLTPSQSPLSLSRSNERTATSHYSKTQADKLPECSTTTPCLTPPADILNEMPTDGGKKRHPDDVSPERDTQKKQ